MAIQLTWLGHNCWRIDTGRHILLVDPFLTDNPAAPCKAADVTANYILLSHGHADHVGDCVEIATRCGATVIANYEICEWLAARGVQKTAAHNLGGGSRQDFGRVKLTLAHHSSVLPDGAYGGNPCGLLLWLDGATLYFACDTALFADMQLIGTAGLDVAVLPIGDVYTMGPDDSLEAIKLLAPKRVVPCHYNTWPPIAQDTSEWARRVRAETSAEAVVLEPGGTFSL